MKPVHQSFEVRAVDKPLKGKKVESGVVLDVKPVDQPLEGKNDLETAFATGFLYGWCSGTLLTVVIRNSRHLPQGLKMCFLVGETALKGY